MKLAWKLTLLLAVAAAGPLIVATQYTVAKGTRSLREQLQQQFSVRARLYASLTDEYLREHVASLQRTVQATGLDDIGESAQREFARFVYLQNRHVSATALFSADGKQLGEAMAPAKGNMSAEMLKNHEVMDEQDLANFQKNIAIEEAVQKGVVFSVPYISIADDGAAIPRVAITLAIARKEGAPAVLAAEISLRHLVDRFGDDKTRGAVVLFDAENRAIIHPDPAVMQARGDLTNDPALKAARGEGTGFVTYGVPVQIMPWTVLVSEPEETALAPVTRQRDYARYAVLVGLLAAFIVGALAVRTVTGRLGRLREAAAKIASGDLQTKVEIKGRDELGELGTAFNEMVRGLQERQRLKQTFSRYVSGEIAARILSESSDLELKGEQVEVTVLFIDMRGFTSFSEKHTPREVVDLLNSYFEEIVGAVLNHDGVINKFIGDAVVAVFGVPRAVPHPEERALAAAVEIQRRIAILNAERKARGMETANFGVGINTGPAIAGNIGSAQRMEYTVIGDAVNLAQRLNGQAKEGEVIVSRATMDRVRKERFASEPRGPVKVRGKEVSVETFAVVADREAA